MKNHLIAAIALLTVAFPVFTMAAENLKVSTTASVEQELEKFSDLLASQLRKANVQKLTILDLVDTEKKNVRLGAFIAEETTVNLVSSTNTFVVVDRANLDKILEEHKLSRTGLENPEDIKKLGQFSGVDAIISGTITPLQDEIRFTAKVISTRTADVLGGAKGRIPRDAEILKMVETRPSVATNGPPAHEPLRIEENAKQIGDILLKLESMKLVVDSAGAYGYLTVTVILKNMSEKRTLAVGIPTASGTSYAATVIRNAPGDEFLTSANEISGIPVLYSSDQLLEIQPGESIEAILKYQGRFAGKGGDYGPYRFQAEVEVGEPANGRTSNVKRSNFIFDVAKAK